NQPISWFGVRAFAKHRTRRQRLLSVRTSRRASKRIRFHHGGPDSKAKTLLFLFLRRVALSRYQPHAVRVHTDAEGAGRRFQRVARGHLRPADNGRRTRRLQPNSIQRSVASYSSQSAWTQHYSVKPHLSHLASLSIAPAGAQQS